MSRLVELRGRTFAIEYDGPSPQRDDTGVIISAERVAILHGLDDAAFYRHGHNSWSPCGWRRLSEPPLRIADPERRATADDTVWDDPIGHHSSAVAALQGDDGNVLLLGALGLDTARLAADRDTLVGWFEQHHAPWFLAYGPEDEVFSAYTRHLEARFGRAANRTDTVWCSWYAYYEDITETLIHKEVAALTNQSFDVLQVDDGWELAVGDWQPNHKFPSGMRSLAARINDAGMTAGLWIAPFIALPDSHTAIHRDQLLLRDAQGRPAIAGHNWGTGYHALDVTRPDTRDYLAELIGTVVHDWGFRYLKLDFINAAAAPGVRDLGREQAYRDALTLIRSVAGPDVYLLGSGAMLLPSLGLLDGIRTGPDVAPIWQNHATDDPSDAMARNAVVNTVHRLWQAPLLQLDPDIIYFRSRFNLLTDTQKGWLRDLATICGFRAVSDPTSWLCAEEFDDMNRFLRDRPPVQRTGRYTFRIGDRDVDFTAAVAPESATQLYPIA